MPKASSPTVNGTKAADTQSRITIVRNLYCLGNEPSICILQRNGWVTRTCHSDCYCCYCSAHRPTKFFSPAPHRTPPHVSCTFLQTFSQSTHTRTPQPYQALTCLPSFLLPHFLLSTRPLLQPCTPNQSNRPSPITISTSVSLMLRGRTRSNVHTRSLHYCTTPTRSLQAKRRMR
jgi:hypothetical protein